MATRRLMSSKRRLMSTPPSPSFLPVFVSLGPPYQSLKTPPQKCLRPRRRVQRNNDDKLAPRRDQVGTIAPVTTATTCRGLTDGISDFVLFFWFFFCGVFIDLTINIEEEKRRYHTIKKIAATTPVVILLQRTVLTLLDIVFCPVDDTVNMALPSSSAPSEQTPSVRWFLIFI